MIILLMIAGLAILLTFAILPTLIGRAVGALARTLEKRL